MSTKKKISIVVPAHNEAGNIKLMSQKLLEVMAKFNYEYEILFVDDGSSDNSLEILQQLNKENPRIHFVELSRNFGHQNALKAGLDLADGDCVVSLDCDMQHPPELIETFIKKWEEGYEIVYSRRKETKNISLFKKYTSLYFYRLINQMSEVRLENGTADFRLIDRKVANIFQEFPEHDPFIRGLVKWTGFRKYGIDYDPNERHSGESSYSTKKMIRLAIQGLTSFSVKPLYAAVYLGFVFSLVAILYIPYVLYSLCIGEAVLGWASLIMTITFFAGLQLMIMGIIGIYIGKIFMQSKQRPNYIIRNTSYEA
ncbi:MAG: glycosyltransferase family 2 protein [Sphingobacteriaceae bacterium]